MTDVGDDPAEAEVGLEPERRHGAITETAGDRLVLHPALEGWTDLARDLLTDGFAMCFDLTAVDYLTYRGWRRLPEGVVGERFEVIAAFWNVDSGERLWAKVQVPVADPVLASITTFYPGVDFLEREIFDMFGIDFAGHPDLSRILMPETWQGHPLRKDYAIGAIPVQFKGAPGPR